MSQNHLTRWTEIADERHFCEAAVLDQASTTSELNFLHLGGVIAQVPSWVHHGSHELREAIDAVLHPICHGSH